MKDETNWLAYSDLAWVDQIISGSDDYAEETDLLVKTIMEHSSCEIKTILHLGCGAGFNDYTFKRYFQVTGIDISPGMLDIARKVNQEIDYHYGDMRNIELGKSFDAVVVPDSIDYMRTEDDLFSAIMTANKHLKSGGMLLIVAHPAELFSQNNFVYTGSDQDIEITVFENNYVLAPPKRGYEATLLYLIRRHGELQIFSDLHLLGLFKLQKWLELINKAGFDNIIQTNMDHTYDRFVMDGGKYPQLVFICSKCQENTAGVTSA